MKNWKKAITFSYDDGVTQDRRLIELFNKYGMKGTFNLNSELLGQENAIVREGVLVNHTKVKPEEVRSLYAGHEIAAHTLTHPNLAHVTDDQEIIRQVERDRENLSQLAGYEVIGMAYPGGGINFSAHAAKLIEEHTGVRYARTTVCNYGFEVQKDLYQFKPSVYHVMEMDRMFELGKKFLESTSKEQQIFYVWGHSYEFDIFDTWKRFEEFLKMMSGHEDIFYGTNRQVLLGE
ncbi:MAG: polysaccharide deacetylase family protein [Lachnospiraceae bacterium]|nr:polysaccharide deacetylase family protein [Lachnospiraceae bacterium]